MSTAIISSSALPNSARTPDFDSGHHRSVRSTDYVGSEPTWNADDLLVLNEDDVADLVRAAINAREVKPRSRSAMALSAPISVRF